MLAKIGAIDFELVDKSQHRITCLKKEEIDIAVCLACYIYTRAVVENAASPLELSLWLLRFLR